MTTSSPRRLSGALLVVAACSSDHTPSAPHGPEHVQIERLRGLVDEPSATPRDLGDGLSAPIRPTTQEEFEQSVACDETTPHLAPVTSRTWPDALGWVRVDEIVFRVGCLPRSLLANHLAARERELIGCFVDRASNERATIVLRSEWIGTDYEAEVGRAEVRDFEDDALASCLRALLAQLRWRSTERVSRAVVDLRLTRGFSPREGGTVAPGR